MRSTFRIAFTGTLAIVLLGMVSVSTASAQCALFGWHKAGTSPPQAWQGTSRLTPASLSLAAGQAAADDRIVGFWKVKFVSEGTPGIPDGTVIDNAFVQWHGDGTEIMNSSRPPATGNFCLWIAAETDTKAPLRSINMISRETSAPTSRAESAQRASPWRPP